MKTQPESVRSEHETLSEEAGSLLAATADSADAGISDARQRLSEALEGGKRIYGRVKEKVVEGAKATDSAVHAHPYIAIAVGVGVGALIGFLLSRRCSRGG
jgi:ElaB/YqjD/DUF883 family membrane-anchored ribosome-binding protein